MFELMTHPELDTEILLNFIRNRINTNFKGVEIK